ncbi:unnamed protein product, partial [Echinostoma caproni]|uniref:Mlh1_C domain-containing protein n=1 Tax=Echinostoma caproni TaxID=27848 RepID=A0A183AXH8_9TREM
EEFNGISTTPAPSIPFGPSTAIVLNEDANETHPMHTESSPMDTGLEGTTGTRRTGNEIATESALDSTGSNSTKSVWTRASLEQKLHRVDLDLMPKIIYAESPTVTALLRADVTRYLEFRFVSRLLALTVSPSSGNAQSDSTQNQTDKVQPSSESRETYSTRPIRELLTENRNLDSFTQQLVTNNLALGSDEITTKEVCFRQLLLLFTCLCL